jgi:hypothetical protein
MQKFSKILWDIILLLASLPLIKGFYDLFTAPGTGLLVTAGVDNNTLIVMTAIPWVFPLIAVIKLFYDMTKPDDNTTGKINFPK